MISLLDLPKLILEYILERLSPADLRNMMQVCSYLRQMCSSDHLWEKHLKRKWCKVFGDAAYREWQSYVASKFGSNLPEHKKEKRMFEPFRSAQLEAEKSGNVKKTTLPLDSVMALYIALESGEFWFPVQIYYRHNGYTGDMLLCYDAQVSYDSQTNSFRARNSSNGCGTGEENSIEWDRLRVPPIDIPPFMYHMSNCLHELKPGDHIEIQWRSRTNLPYDAIVVEFNQYPRGSRWRQTMLSRTHHPREGNTVDGYFGGIRKLSDEEEIAKWMSFWPNNQFLIGVVRFANFL